MPSDYEKQLEQIARDRAGAPEPDKPMVLRDQPFVEVTVRFYRSWLKGIGGVYSFGEGTTATTVHDETDAEIGVIDGRMGAFELRDRRRPYSFAYRAPHDEVWYAFQRALNAQQDQQLPPREDDAPDETERPAQVPGPRQKS